MQGWTAEQGKSKEEDVFDKMFEHKQARVKPTTSR